MAAILCAGTLNAGKDHDWNTETTDHLNTAQGLVQIELVGMGGYRLSVGGRLIKELEGFLVGISTAASPGDSPQYVLVKINKGGGSCPQLYRLLDLSPGRTAYLTPEFGNCATAAAMAMQGNDVSIDFRESQDFEAQTFLYETKHRRLRAGPYRTTPRS